MAEPPDGGRPGFGRRGRARAAGADAVSRVVVTGGAGFVGVNLSDALLSSGEDVVVLDNLSRAGVEANL
ncbi:MAG: NAD-dependent epimerase/dehydratase family protein, partial [Gammaproteobacteria bacterium]|nr:NAD-dependent epimerase/dehydratase family protein [Gammaproteobacteria bacterium]